MFSHMDALGIQLHVVLTETENEDLLELEEGGVAFADSRRLYYRELVARFAHHRAVVWNLGEENGWDDRAMSNTGPAGRPNSREQRLAFAYELRQGGSDSVAGRPVQGGLVQSATWRRGQGRLTASAAPGLSR